MVPPVGPTVPPVPPPLDELLLLELPVPLPLVDDEDVPHAPVGAAWQWHVSTLHHQPPKQPLLWHVGLELWQAVQQACTSGPSRLPHVSLPLLLELLDGAAPPMPPAPPAPTEPPQTLVCGTQSCTCWPSAPLTAVQARPAAQGAVEQSGAQ